MNTFPFSITLTLLVTRILADNENLAMASNDLALVAHFLDRRTYLHFNFLSVNAVLYVHTQPQVIILGDTGAPACARAETT